jgi:hypothetical protein
MRIERRFLNWGLFFILVGAVPLAIRAGYLTSGQVASWWTLWPLILVGIGVGLILSRTPLEFLGGLLIAGTLGLMAGSILGAGFGVGGFPGTVCGNEAGRVAFSPRSGTFTAPATVSLRLDCGDLTVTATEGAGWTFEGMGEDASGPRFESGDSSLSIRSDREGPQVAFLGKRETWRVGLPNTVPLDLDVRLNAGSATLAPGGAAFRSVDVQMNAGSVHLDLGAATALDDLRVQGNAGAATIVLPNLSFTGSLQVNAGSIEFCAPPGAALRLRTNENIVASYDYGGHGLVRSGTTWETPGFASAAVRIDLRTQANAGSMTLNPEGGCGG